MDISSETLKDRLRRIEALSGQITFGISRMSKLLEVEGAARITGSGLTLTGYRILLVVSIFEELSVSDLSRIMVIDRAQISRASSELIAKGYLSAAADPTSRRKKLLRLTDEGRAHFEPLAERFAERQAAFEELLSDPDMAALRRAIDKISHWCENSAAEA